LWMARGVWRCWMGLRISAGRGRRRVMVEVGWNGGVKDYDFAC
jgi:hypothetical protein